MTRCLVLIPTASELQHLPQHFLEVVERNDSVIELCGFGPIVAAARTAELIAQLRPSQVVLCGIAGTMNEELQIGSAYNFGAVACYGVGVGCGPQYRGAAQVGWQQWPGDLSGPAPTQPVQDMLELEEPKPHSAAPRLLLTACASSSCADDMAHKKLTFPNAAAEDMEGFGVAAACRLANTPLTIIRGISNQVGDRDCQNWKIAEAMIAAVALVEEILEP